MRTIDSLGDLAGKKVFVRSDFNVPLDKEKNITDDGRIRAALPTLTRLIDAGAKVIVSAHLGRPKGEVNPDFSLAPVAARLSELLGKDVAMIHFKDFLRQDADGQLKACGAGQGEMGDYSTILRFAKQEKPFVFATLENTTPENAVACREFLQKQYDNC